MRLIGFSPWQQIETSIPNQSNAECVVHRVIDRPSSFQSFSKRARTSHSQGQKSVADVQADLILSTNHQLSILGHTVSKKILKGNPSSGENALKEIPQWIYTSMPGEQSSFLPNQSSCEKIGAVVDPNSRSVFSLQKENTLLKVWSLDDEVTGPDESLDGNLIEKVPLPSAAVAMEAIPYRQQSHVKIKGHGSNADGADDIQGGIVGLLSCGQVFLVLITAQKTLKVGFYGEEESSQSFSKSRRKSTSNGAKSTSAPAHLYSVVGYTSTSKMATSSSEAGQKRKLDKIEESKDDQGEITLTTMSLDSKKNSAIMFSKHTISLSPVNCNKESNAAHESISASYTKQRGELSLPHDINTSSSSKPVRMTQLDATHVALVYQDPTKTWFATILDTRFGECVIQPFPILLKSSESSVVQIGGLSTSILSILTSDGDITVYDIRRAIILHDFNAYQMLQIEEESDRCELSIVCHWFTGTLGIIKKTVGDKENGAAGCVQASFAKIGMFDSISGSEGGGLGGKALLKGSYNLARAIASSMSATAKMDPGNLVPEIAPPEQDMMDWFHCTNDTGKKKSNCNAEASFLHKLEVQSNENGSSKTTMSGIFSDVVRDFAKNNGVKSPLRNGCSTKETKDNFESIPQRVIDVTVAAAVDKILSTQSKADQKIDALQVLIKCIKSRMFSGRNHFDKATNENRKDVFRSILGNIEKLNKTNDSLKQNVENSPLNLLYHLLHYCDDALPEHMLISMVHFILCRISADEFRKHSVHLSKNSTWYCDPSIKVLEKRLKKAQSQSDENGESEELTELIKRLDNRLVAAQKLFYIEKIVTHSKCNSALLRSAMRDGLTQSRHGEVEVLTQALSKLLREVGKEKKHRKADAPNASSCVAQWLSAVIDSNMSTFLSSSGSNKKASMSIESARKEVTAAVLQTKALLGLEELLDHAESVLQDNGENSSRSMDVAPPPLYGIESLIF